MKNIVVTTYPAKLRTKPVPGPTGHPCSTLRCRHLSLLSADCPPGFGVCWPHALTAHTVSSRAVQPWGVSSRPL